MREEKGRRWKEENDSKGRSWRGRKGRRKGRRYASGLKAPNQKCWLSLRPCERIQFRTAMTAHRCLNGLSPVCLSELCVRAAQRQSRYHLRSSLSNQLAVPTVKSSTYGARSCPAGQVAGTTYTRLSQKSSALQRDLKTFLFA